MRRKAADLIIRQFRMYQPCNSLQYLRYLATGKILFLIVAVQEDRKRFVVKLTKSFCLYNYSLCSFDQTYFCISIVGNNSNRLPIFPILLYPESYSNLYRLAVRVGCIYDLSFFIVEFPISFNKCFCYPLARWVLMDVDFCLIALSIFGDA